MTKKSKAETVLELLNKGWSIKKITSSFAVSAGYVSKLKKEMVHAQTEEPKPAATKEETKTPPNPVEKVLTSRSNADEDPLGKLLDQRASQYGSFMASANVAIRLKGVMHNAIAQQDLHLAPDQLLALDMIAVKISRLLTGNPSHKDSWVDIAGYAKLVADRLQGTVR